MTSVLGIPSEMTIEVKIDMTGLVELVVYVLLLDVVLVEVMIVIGVVDWSVGEGSGMWKVEAEDEGGLSAVGAVVEGIAGGVVDWWGGEGGGMWIVEAEGEGGEAAGGGGGVKHDGPPNNKKKIIEEVDGALPPPPPLLSPRLSLPPPGLPSGNNQGREDNENRSRVVSQHPGLGRLVSQQ